jgi:hypothetical protein
MVPTLARKKVWSPYKNSNSIPAGSNFSKKRFGHLWDVHPIGQAFLSGCEL